MFSHATEMPDGSLSYWSWPFEDTSSIYEDTMLIFTVLTLVLIPVAVESLECYSCTNVTFLAHCNSIVVCPTETVCHADYSTYAGIKSYTLGCKSLSTCSPEPTSGLSSGSIVGRSTRSEDNGSCSQCCEKEMCNRQLCQSDDPSCADTTDCSAIGALSNICLDVDHIKHACKRYCGLCNLVDGGWSEWSTWSSCDATCENGTKTRARMCSDPAPANGGSTCVGNRLESETCTSDIKCPVPGGWGKWSSWGSCSVSCDIGVQRRDRSCSHPYPTNAGDHCFGEPRDDRLCFPGPCADGQWSHWGRWGSCAVTCDGGLMTRSRTCNNPTPSLTGRYCVGNQQESVICNKQSCQATVTFTAKDLTGSGYSPGQHLVYSTTITNVGGGYDSRTGYFTAPVKGTYQFNVHICAATSQWVEVLIKANGHDIASANHITEHHDGSCGSGYGIAVLSMGDKVWIECSYPSHFHGETYEWNSFSGILIGS